MRFVGVVVLACTFVTACDQQAATEVPTTTAPVTTAGTAELPPPIPLVPSFGDTLIDQYATCAGAMAALGGLTENDDPASLPQDNLLEPHVAFMINALEAAGVENEQRIARIKTSINAWSAFSKQQQEARAIECRTKFNSH